MKSYSGISVYENIANWVENLGIAEIEGYCFISHFGYPAFLPEPKNQMVKGELLLIKNPLELFNYLDAYEDYFPLNEEKSMYIREILTVSQHTQFFDAFVYVWNTNFNLKS